MQALKMQESRQRNHNLVETHGTGDTIEKLVPLVDPAPVPTHLSIKHGMRKSI